MIVEQWGRNCSKNDSESKKTLYNAVSRRLYFLVCGSFNNPNFNKVENNPICIDIAWYDDEDKVKKWEMVRIIILC